MRYKIKSIATVYLSIMCLILSAQQNLKRYEFGFDFVDGIYLTFEEFKNNDPSIKMKNVIVKLPENPYDFNVKSSFRSIQFYDKNGTLKEIKLKEIWGLCYDDEIYISYHNRLNELFKIGAISYFVKNFRGMQDDGLSQYPISFHNYSKNLLDFKTGKIYAFSIDNFSEILKHDPELFIEFEEIKSKKQKMRCVVKYLMMYNERNPIYFPMDHQKAFNTEHAVEVKFD